MSARKEGRALLKMGGSSAKRYVADILIAGGLIHAENVLERFGACGDYHHRRVADRAWPLRSIREIRWISEQEVTQ